MLGLLAAGAPNRAIAEELVVTLETVNKHLSHLFDELGWPTAPRRSPGRRSWGYCRKAAPSPPDTRWWIT